MTPPDNTTAMPARTFTMSLTTDIGTTTRTHASVGEVLLDLLESHFRHDWEVAFTGVASALRDLAHQKCNDMASTTPAQRPELARIAEAIDAGITAAGMDRFL